MRLPDSSRPPRLPRTRRAGSRIDAAGPDPAGSIDRAASRLRPPDPPEPGNRWERRMTGLEVVFTREGVLGILRLAGEARQEVIHHLHDQAKRALSEGARSLVLDCSRLAFMDSASTGALLKLEKDLAAQGGRLVLCGVPRVIHRLFDAAGLVGRFRVASDEAQGRFLALGD